MTVPIRPLRVALIIRSLGVGGAERQLAALAMGLAARGHAVLVIPYYDGGVWRPGLEAGGVLVVPLGKRSRWDMVGPMVRLRRTIRDFGPDIVHGYLPDGNLVSLLVARLFHRAKVVWGIRAAHYDFRIYDVLFWLLFRMSCWTARAADLIIANAVAGRTYHVTQGYPAERCIVIPNGIDTDHFHPDPVRRKRQRGAWSVGDGEMLVGIVARLDPMKDHSTFLRAAALLVSCLPAVRFVAVGDGPAEYRTRLLALASQCGLEERLHWVPVAEDLVAVYNALDLLVSVSTTGEGFPNVIGEAMACGVACVVTDVGDSAVVVGKSGIVVPPGDPTVLVEGWRRGLAWLSDEARPNPRRLIVEEFSHELMVSRTEQVLGALVDRETAT